MKKSSVVLMITFLVGNCFSSLEGSHILGVEEKKELIEGLKGLPQELRSQIVSLSLQAEVGGVYELFKQINIQDSIDSVMLNSGGSTDFDGSYDRRIAELMQVRALLRGRKIKSFTKYGVTSVALSPDGKTILTGSCDNTARLWDLETGQEIKQFSGTTDFDRSYDRGTSELLMDMKALLEGRKIKSFTKYGVTSVAFSPDGKTVLIGSSDKTARLCDVDTGKELKLFAGHTGGVSSVVFSPNGKTVLTGSCDNTARLWCVDTGKEIQQFIGHADDITSVAFSPDGKTVIIGAWNSTTSLWDVNTGQKLRQFADHAEGVYSVAFSPDGKTILIGSASGTACLCDVDTGKEIQLLIGHADDITSVALSPDGKTVLIGSSNYTAELWQVETAKKLQEFSDLTGRVTSVAFSSNGSFIALGSVDGTFYLLKRHYTFTSEQQEEAYEVFKQKGLYHILANTPAGTTKESQSS